MPPLMVLGMLLVTVFIGAAVLAPWLYWAVQAAASVFPWLHDLANNPFHRYVNRCLLGLALVSLWPFLRALGIRSCRDVGLVPPRRQAGPFGFGLAFGLLSLGFILAIPLAAGAGKAQWPAALSIWIQHGIKALSAAATVALLEEVLFRGAVFGTLRKTYGDGIALGISSLLYAWVHFLARPPAPAEIHWNTGFVILAGMMRGLWDFEQLVPGFVNLSIVGLLLGVAYQRSGSLYCSLGMHAGWILGLKTGKLLVQPLAGRYDGWWGSDKIIDGWLATGVLGLGLVVLMQWPFGRSDGKAISQPSGKTA